MSLNRREMLRMGALGVSGVMLTAATDPGSLFYGDENLSRNLAPRPRPAPVPAQVRTPANINMGLLQRGQAAMQRHGRHIAHRDVMALVDFSAHSRAPRFHIVDLMNGQVQSYRVTHGSGSDPHDTGYLTRFSNTPETGASSAGAYTTGEYYHGQWGRSMRVHGRDQSNSNALARLIVIHSAWYAEPEVVQNYGKLGRSLGCFTFSLADRNKIMSRIEGGRLIYADKV